MQAIGGTLVVEALKRHGIDTIFTLNGGHLFPIYDACVKGGVRLVDTRHEATAAFAAEGLAKLTRKPAVVAVTAGPGVTNAISAMASAQANGAPVLFIGGRAPQARWGQGSLQEMDHPPLVAGVTKLARTVLSPNDTFDAIDQALLAATTPHRGPVFLDFPLDSQFTLADVEPSVPPSPPRQTPDAARLEAIADLLAAAEAPLLVAGSDVYWAGAWQALRELAEAGQVPVVQNGMGRGLLPADHPLCLSRARSAAFKGADLVLVAGTPLDFRLGFGQFGKARVVHLTDHESLLASHLELAGALCGDLELTLRGIAGALPDAPTAQRTAWARDLAAEEQTRRQAEEPQLTSPADPIHPTRLLGELGRLLDDDAVVIGDGGDFVSFAGKLVDSQLPGRWMDPGPFGCLGMGLGYAIAARLAHPGSQVVLLAGDGALGFSVMDFDSLVRHKLPVTIVVGNNGIWGLEKHPMKQLFGYSAVSDLQPACRYDQLAQSLGGEGILVQHPAQIRPALERGLACPGPVLINVLIDPEVAYPRRANLA